MPAPAIAMTTAQKLDEIDEQIAALWRGYRAYLVGKNQNVNAVEFYNLIDSLLDKRHQLTHA